MWLFPDLQVLITIVELGVPGVLKRGPKDEADIAAAVGAASQEALARVLDNAKSMALLNSTPLPSR